MVEYITYNEQKYPIRVSFFVIKRLQQDGLSLDDLGYEDIVNYEPLLFYALQSGHKAMSQEMTFKREDMEDVLEECFWELQKLVPKFFPKEVVEKAETVNELKKLNSPNGENFKDKVKKMAANQS